MPFPSLIGWKGGAVFQTFPFLIGEWRVQEKRKAARLLEIPVVVTEQYPQGLGPTVPELGAEGLKKFSKTCFSMLGPEVERELGALPHLRSVLLCGIETQACIMIQKLIKEPAPDSGLLPLFLGQSPGFS
nr:isochorismatase domain-containing protein 2 [Pelodiscus sinensis]|eukprot:XP_025034914.1 isochorismatase domain-containing protein 2 [Pelodiscus sinensis]